ncbi:MAG: phage portal protein [Rhodospirillaceae bacterium]
MGKPETGAASKPRAGAIASAPAHVAADTRVGDLAAFLPGMKSADAAFLPERSLISRRIQDQVRNDGWTASTLNRYVDHAIGSNFRLSYQPDWRALGIDRKEAYAFTQEVEKFWRGYVDDPRQYCDATEQTNFTGVVGLAFRHRMGDGEVVAALRWLERDDFPFRTAMQVIDPDRLSNPNDEVDTDRLRGGVELNALGAAQAYHFRATHPGDVFFGQSDTYKWNRVPKRTKWGRPMVVHQFERERAGQTRGKSGLTTVVKKIFMANKYADAEMQAAVINAMLSLFIKSPMDTDGLAEMLSTKGAGSAFDNYIDARTEFHQKGAITLGGARIPHLFPNEDIATLDTARPNANYAEFEKRVLRYFAASTGQSYEQAAADYSETNYSSARAAILDSWKFLSARLGHFAQGFCTPWFFAWLEDAVDGGVIKLPKGAPEFWKAPAAYARCRWNGPGRGWIDPTKEAQASQLRMDSQISTLAKENAEQGEDWRETLEQQAFENEVIAELGLKRTTSNTIVEEDEDQDTADEEENSSRTGNSRERGNVREVRPGRSRIPQVPRT